MLWYKAWRETRTRFLLGSAALGAAAAVFLASDRSTFFPEPLPYSRLVWHGVWAGLSPLYVFLSLLVGFGGLSRERTVGTALYTLSLPVTRLRLVTTQWAVGLIELTVLAMIPVVLVSVLSPLLQGEPYPIAHGLRFALLFIACGALFFAVSCAWSTVVSTDYNAAAACLLSPFAYLLILDQVVRVHSRVTGESPIVIAARIRGANPFHVMTGSGLPYLDPDTFVVSWLPWRTLAAVGLATISLLTVAARSAARRNY